MEILLLIIIPVITCLLFWITDSRKFIGAVNACGSVLLLAVSLLIASRIIENKVFSPDVFNHMFYVDSLSAIILFVITLIGVFVSLYSIGYMNEEFRRNVISIKKFKLYFSLMHIFILTMLFTSITQNMGLMWISIEATTLASAFLVGFYNDKKSLEAAWKYIIICSVGIAFALLGIILLYYSSVQTMGQSAQGLNWQFLLDNSGKLQGSILKLSFIFILIGFGTKAGFAPMHTWLPDAHSQAPSPISALLSGVLLNTAMYGILRVMVIANKTLGSSLFTGRILIVMGLISVGTAAVFILVQSDYKRLLAYSSIEHMGIIAFGFGLLTPLSIFGALYHMLNHALTKSMLFISSGNIYLKYETKKISQVQGILKVMPVTGTAFLLGLFAITGMPPFSIFTSELSIITASFGKAYYFGVALLLLFLVLIFAGFVSQMVKMVFGAPSSEEVTVGEPALLSSVILIVFLVIISVTGFYIPGPLKTLIDSARDIIVGG